jgi:hypothetical protein
MKDKPAALYVYPEATDIASVAQALKAGRSPAGDGIYWNASCLREIRAPKFWAKERLEPVLVRYAKDHPAPAPRPTPMCSTR